MPADFAHGGNQTSSLQFRVLNMPVLKFNASQCYPNADKEDSGKIQNSRCMQGTGLSLTITACSAAQQGHQHHHRSVCPSSPCNIRNLFLSLPPRSLTMFLSGEDQHQALVQWYPSLYSFCSTQPCEVKNLCPNHLIICRMTRENILFHLFSRCQGLTYRSLCLTSNVKSALTIPTLCWAWKLRLCSPCALAGKYDCTKSNRERR